MSLNIFEILFWVGAGACLYVYFGYPLLVYALGLLRGPGPVYERHEPGVSIIISAYNEEKHIREKLENTLELDYPEEKREIIVGSDGSSDATVDIAMQFADRGVRVLDFETNRGKTAVQNDCVHQASGEALVFMDAASMCNREALRNLVRHFSDPTIGCVAGRIEFVDRAGNLVGASQGLYWKYEQALKRMESRIGALVGVDGPLYAVRRNAYVELADDMISDLITPLLVREQGLSVVLEPEAVALEDATKDSSGEFATRRRVVARGMLGLARIAHLLNFAKYGFLSLQILSHKILRWCVGSFAIIMFASSVVLYSQPMYAALAAAQAVFYLLAAIGFATVLTGFRPLFLTIPYYFVLVNVAALAGIFSFLRGERIVAWKPTRD